MHFQVVGAGDAVVDGGIGGQAVERQAFGKHVMKIELEQARQRLQAEDAQQLGRARVLLEELAFFHVHGDLARQRGQVQRIRQAVPGDVALEEALAVADGAHEAEAVEQLAGVADVQIKIEVGRVGIGARDPLAGAGQLAVGIGQRQLADAPFARVGQLHVVGLQVELAQRLVEQFETLDLDVQCRNGGCRTALAVEQIGHVAGGRGRDHQRRQARRHLAQAMAGGRLAPRQVAVGLGGIDIGLPDGLVMGHAHHHVFQLAGPDQQRAGARGNRVRHHVLAEVGAVGRAGTVGAGSCTVVAGHGLAEVEPGVGIYCRQTDVERQAAFRLGRRRVNAEPATHQFPRRLAGGGHGFLALVAGGNAAAQRDADVVVQHAARVRRQATVEHEAQRHGVQGRFADRRRQVQRQPGQGRVHRHHQLVVAHGHGAVVARRAREVARQALHHGRLIRLAETVGRQHAAQLDDDGVVALGAARDRYRTVEEQAGQLVEVDAALVEFDLALGRLHDRQIVHQHDVVVIELQRTLHLGVDQVRQRQLQLERQRGVAGGLRVFREVRNPFQHRAVGHVLEKFLHRAGRVAVDFQHRIVEGQIGDHGLDVGERHAAGSGRVATDFHAAPLEHEAALDVFGLRPQRQGLAVLAQLLAVEVIVVGRVVELAVGELARHLEFAMRRMVALERKMRQLAAHAHADVAGRAAFQRTGQPGVEVVRGLQRQVAVDAVELEAVERAGQVHHARALAVERHGVRAVQGTGQALLQEVHAVDAQLQLVIVLERPAGLQVEPVERHGRIGKVAGQLQHQLFRVEVETAALVAGVNRTGQVLEAGDGGHGRRGGRFTGLRLRRARRLRLQTQSHQVALQAVRLQGRETALPLGGKIAQQAAGRGVGQQRALVGRERQARGDAGQRAQVELCGAELDLFRPGAGSGRVRGRQRRRFHHQAVAGGQGQVADVDADTARAKLLEAGAGRARRGQRRQVFVGGNAARQLLQIEQRQVLGQHGGDLAQVDVGSKRRQALLVEAEPGAQRAAARMQFERHVDPRLPGRHVGIAQVGVQLALPHRRIRDARAKGGMGEVGADIERAGQCGGRRGPDRQLMVQPVVAQPDRDAGQRQRRRPALQVGPADAAVADDDFALQQQPFQALAIVGFVGIEILAGQEQAAVALAADVEVGPVERERMEPRLGRKHGPPRQRGRHARQAQGGLAAAVVQDHVVQQQIGAQPVPGRVDAGDGDRVAGGAAGDALDVGAVVLDIGQHCVAQHEEQNGQRKIQQQRELDGEPEDVMGGLIAKTIGGSQPRWLAAAPDRAAKSDAIARQDLAALDLDAMLAQEAVASPGAPALPLGRAMRRLRNLLVCGLIRRDLAGQADLAEVVEAMTRFADFAIARHVAELDAELRLAHGVPTGRESGAPQELMVLAMGKQGGRELNVSSDIDLIFVYPEDGDTAAGPGQRGLSNHEYFIRLGKKLIAALAEITEDGYTFRVDMALRPNGGSGPLAASLSMVENYLIVQGREWERYAWVKARAVTGRDEDIAALDAIVRPFVFRRYLDFGVIDAIRTMHAQIRAEVNRQERLHPDRSNNVKLGRGGIREIEFLTQVFQLIRGGRDAALRDRSTRTTLRIVAEKGLLSHAIVYQLLASYTFLRNLEHRLQYLDDAQTHTLPASDADRQLVAEMMGLPDVTTLLSQLEAHRQFVAGQFDEMFSDNQAPDRHLAGAAAAVAARSQPQSSAGADQHGAAADRRVRPRNGRRQPARHAGPAARFPGSGGAPVSLPVAADRVPAHAGARDPHGARERLGRQVPQPAPDPARRTAGRPHPQRHVRPGQPGRRPAPATRCRCRRYRTANGHPARNPPRPAVPPAGPGPGRRPDRGTAGRPSVRAGRHHRGGGHRRHLADGGHAPPRGAAVCRHCLRQAGRQGARLCIRPRRDLPVRRPGSGRAGPVRQAGAAVHHLDDVVHVGRHPVRHRHRAAPGRRLGHAGVERGRVRKIPDQLGVGVGTPGAHARALLRRRRGHRPALRPDPRRRAAQGAPGRRPAAHRGDRHAQAHGRRPAQPHGNVRPQAGRGRHDRHRVHGPVPGAAACGRVPGTHRQHGQYRAAETDCRAGPDRCRPGGQRGQRVPQAAQAAAPAAPAGPGPGARRSGAGGGGGGPCAGVVG
uniref:Uncharacterized protein n=1 Tax=Tanacetum cinerariifolium TaxID=118510 RepID=A0A699GDW6_TANCI|nr:hypothetical protein [Tanacetum cinerariifolium]